MHEEDVERQPELNDRLARLEAELNDQRTEVAALWAEVERLQNVGRATEYVLHPRKPAAEPPPVVPAPTPRPWLPPTPAAPPAPKPPAPEPPPPNRIFTTFSEPTTTPSKPEAHRSVENRIGAQLFNWVAIIALVTGVALFLKLVVDKHLIHFTPTGRIVTGLAVGTAVIVGSEYLRRKGYAAFSYSLKAVGTATLYLTLWASFHIYHLLPAGVALTAMIAVTLWNAIMAWAQDSELLATYALIGGFVSPMLLSTGENHEAFIFSYVLALDVALLLLLWKKPWHRLLLGAFPGTVIYFIGWYSKFFTADQAGTTGLFAVLLAIPFMALPLIGKQREEGVEGLIAPLAAGSFLSMALYSVLEDSHRHSWLPWGAVVLAAVYLLLMRLRRGGIAEAIHLALAVIFLTIAIPLKAEGRWITIGWLAEGVALLWVAARLLGPGVQTRVRALMRWLACGALALGVAESLIFWSQQSMKTSFWNGRFATEMAAVAALALAAWLARHPAEEEDTPATSLNAPDWPVISLLCTVVCNIIGPLAVSRELSIFWSNGTPAEAAYNYQLDTFSIASFLMVYAACLVAWIAFSRGKRTAGVRSTLGMIAAVYLALGFIAMVLTPTVGDGSPVHVFFNARLIFQMCGVASMALVAWFARLARRSTETDPATAPNWPFVTVYSTLAAHLVAALAAAREISAYWTASTLPSSAYRSQLHAISVEVFLMIYGACLVAWVAARPKAVDEAPGQRTMLRILGCIYLAIGTVGIIITPIVGDGGPVRVFWNTRLLMELLGLAALGTTTWLAWRAWSARKVTGEYWAETAAWGLIAFNFLAVLTGVREIMTYFGIRATGDAGFAQAFTISAWLMLYAAALLAAGFWRRTAFVRWQGLILMVFTIGKVFVYDLSALSSIYRVLSFIVLGALLMAVSFAYQKDWLKLREEVPTEDEVSE